MAKKKTFHLQISGPDFQQELDIPVGITSMGRETDNHILFNSPRVSRHHARFECTDTEAYITDLDSANGTVINGQPIPPQSPTLLVDKTFIIVGPFKILFQQKDAAEDPTAAAAPINTGPQTVARKAVLAAAAAEVKEPVDKTLDLTPKVEKKESAPKAEKKPPVTPPPPPPPANKLNTSGAEGKDEFFPGLSLYSSHLIDYLPGIYQTDFMLRFLALYDRF